MSIVDRHHLEVFVRGEEGEAFGDGDLTITLPDGSKRVRPFRLVLDGNDLVTQDVEIENAFPEYSGKPIYIATIKLIVGDLQVTEVEDPSKLEPRGGTLVMASKAGEPS